MVTFDSYRLPHVLDISVQDSEILNERGIPGGPLPYRSDQTSGGRVIVISGEIRDASYALRIEELRVRINDLAGSLNLEDGSDVVTAKLCGVDVSWTVEEGVGRPTYSATFFETS